MGRLLKIGRTSQIPRRRRRRAMRACGPQRFPLERGEIVAVGDATRLAGTAGLLCARCGPAARGYPLERGEIVAVGDATRCGPAARGILLAYKGDFHHTRDRTEIQCLSSLSFSQICVFTISIPKSFPTFIFQIQSLYDLLFIFSSFYVAPKKHLIYFTSKDVWILLFFKKEPKVIL